MKIAYLLHYCKQGIPQGRDILHTFYIVLSGVPGLEAAEALLEQSLELDSEPQADRDNGHSESTTQRADSGQQSRASAAGGENGLSAEEEPDAEEGQGQLPQDLQWDKVAAAEAREDDYTGIMHVSISARLSEPLHSLHVLCQASN